MSSSALASISQVAFSGVGKLAFLFVTVLLFKSLSVEEAGVFAVAFAIATVLAILSECGLRGLLVRELARAHGNPHDCERLVQSALSSRLLVFLPYFAVGVLAGIVFLPASYLPILLILLLGTWFDSSANLGKGGLRAFNHIVLDAVLAGGFRVVLAIVIAAFYFNGRLTLYYFAISFTTIAIIDLLTTLICFRRISEVSFKPTRNLHLALSIMKRGMPFTILAILGMIYLRTGLLALGLTGTEFAYHQSAGYSLSGRIPEGVSFLPIALMNAAIPFLSRNSVEKAMILPLFRRLELLIGSAAIILSVGILFFAHDLILLLATPDYLQYKSVFLIYGLSIFPNFLQYVYSNILISLNLENRVATRYAIILGINIIMNLALVWKFGAMGAVVALVTCEICSLLIDLYYLRKCDITMSVAIWIQWAIVAAIACLIALAFKSAPGPVNVGFYYLGGGILGAFIFFLTHNKRAPEKASAEA